MHFGVRLIGRQRQKPFPRKLSRSPLLVHYVAGKNLLRAHVLEDILEQSIGMIILSTGNSLPSERTPWRGIWVERNLAETQSGAECIFRLEHPSAVKPAPAPKPEALRRLIEELDDLKGSTDRKYDAAEGRIAYLEDAIGEYEAPPPSPPPPLPDPKDSAGLTRLASLDRFATERAPTKRSAVQIGPGQ
jgi:hypothetical protein